MKEIRQSGFIITCRQMPMRKQPGTRQAGTADNPMLAARLSRKLRTRFFMIFWKKEFETGSEKLDQQHRVLIDNINLLEDLLHTTNPTPKEAKFIIKLVDYLEGYANFHFQGEEQCMESYQCPAHAENQQGHERFRGIIRDYKRLCEHQGFQVELLRNLHQVMSSWITEHILKIDTKLKPCIKK